MHFPGSNTMTLSDEATKSILADALSRQFGPNIRITGVSKRYGGLEIDFTTDLPMITDPEDPAPVEPAPIGGVVDASLD